MEANLTKNEEVEKSIRKKFHKDIFSKFCKAINDFEMILPNDKIAVCISGGKDSMLMSKLFQELKKHNKFPFEVKFFVMDPGYNKSVRSLIEENLKLLQIPAQIFETDIFENVENIEKSPCYICARMRRGHLYNIAKNLGCNKIALGHHFDDVIETVLMGILYGGQFQTMMPKLHSTNFEGMELIRPLYYVHEKDIIHWQTYNKLNFIQCACKFTEKMAEEEKNEHESTSMRKKVKKLIASLTKENPQVEYNIMSSTQNVNLSTILSYKKKNGEKINFLDEYNKKV